MFRRMMLAGLLAAPVLAQPYSTNGDGALEALIEKALERNPAIRESLARYRAARQRIPQVSSLPDPVFGVTQYARTPETRVGPQTTMLSITQKFPWFGKLSDRGKVAAKEAAAWRESHEARKAEVVRQVKLAYYDLAYIDRAIRITEEDHELLRYFETLAQARYAQGVGLQQAVVKLQTELTRDLNRLKTLRSRRVDAESGSEYTAGPAARDADRAGEPGPKADGRPQTGKALSDSAEPASGSKGSLPADRKG